MSDAPDPERYRLAPAAHQRIFEKSIVPQVFRGASPSRHSVAVIFGGQPGAGKSAAVNHASSELRTENGAVILVGDNLRPNHPHYSRLLRSEDTNAALYTDRDTAGWIEKAIAYARDNRYSIVVEGTMRDADKVAETMRGFRDAGFEIDARALAVNPRLSELGILDRYEKQRASHGSGRMTVPAAHEAAYKGMPGTVERIENEHLADRLRVVTRSQVPVFDSRRPDGSTQTGARAALEAERTRPLTVGETHQLVSDYMRIANWMAARDAAAVDRAGVADRLRAAEAELTALRARDHGRTPPR